MNIKQFEQNLESIKKLSPQIYKETMNCSTAFFILHKELFEKGEYLLKKEFSLSQSEVDILASLYYMTEGTFTMSPTQLYDVMLFSSGGMTKVLKKLEKKDLIKRIENKNDKRSKLVQLTKKGITVTLEALESVICFEDKYFSKLTKDEQKVFKDLLLKTLK